MKKNAFTLTEVIIVILVITMIVAITIKGARARLDAITSVNYYTAFKTLNSVVAKMIVDFKPEPEWGFTFNTQISEIWCGDGDPTTGQTGKGLDTDKYEVHCDTDEGEYADSICDPLVCEPKTVSLPRTGELFCKKLIQYLNIKEDSGSVCGGDDITSGTTDFSSKKPDFTLRNGMLIYNASTDANMGFNGELPMLKGNTQREEFDEVPNTNAYGYIVYVDIDGAKNDGILWEDVFPFYLTFSGSVIPAYNVATGDGGDNKFHLQASVWDEHITNGTRSSIWHAQYVTFKEAACLSGDIAQETDYCKNREATTQEEDCKSAEHICELKINKPMKWLK